jgi:hypothetical protein
MCAERQACPAVMSEMLDLGFTDVQEVFNKVDADITARLDFKNKDECDEKFTQLFVKTGEKIGQLSYKNS